MKASSPVERSCPKNPTFAVLPLCHLYSIPLSFPSLVRGGVSPPIVITGSSIVVMVELTIKEVPLTVKSLTVRVPPIFPPPSAFIVPLR